MQPLKAQVRNGRLVLDEPTDLPEGEVVELWPAYIDGDEMDDEERVALNAELEAAEREYAEIGGVSEEQLWATLRANR
ncbi:hypothetical protein LVJ94_04790 [Pendulispora rubella]|uniref:Uncharacterized protein n=1 Tax=Pendulispora rubella TaxID=2741070 RepID=A0ABZ2L6K4_9BACT